MLLEHEFSVPVPVEEAWDVLLDIERVAPCMPGATLESMEGDEIRGRVKVRIGPVTVSYRGTAKFTRRDPEQRTVVARARGAEARGSGSAEATVTAVLSSDPDGGTRVRVSTDLNITGRAAQFGRAMMTEVSGRLIERFADNLAREITGPGEGASPPAGREATGPAPVAAAPAGAGGGEALDLSRYVGEYAAKTVARRPVPLLFGVVGAVLVMLLFRRLRAGRHGQGDS